MGTGIVFGGLPLSHGALNFPPPLTVSLEIIYIFCYDTWWFDFVNLCFLLLLRGKKHSAYRMIIRYKISLIFK